MTMPTGPFVAVANPPALYDETRRRAKARRSRRTALTAALSVAVIALGAGILVRDASTGHGQPLGGSAVPTDAELLAMDPNCRGCEVVTRVEVTGGYTFAVLGSFVPLVNPLGGPSVYRAESYVVADGTAAIASLPAEHTRGYVYEARTDTDGNVMIPFGGDRGPVLEYWAFRVHAGRVYFTRKITGTGPSGFVKRAGSLSVVFMPVCTATSVAGCPDATRWDWDGATYAPRYCADTPAAAAVIGRRCGDLEVPPLAQPSPQPQPTVAVTNDPTSMTDAELVDRARLCAGCLVQGRLELADGRTFAVLGNAKEREYVLARGSRILWELEEIPQTDFASATLLEKPQTDATGNVLLRLSQGGRQWFLPLRLSSDHITLTNGNQGAPPIMSNSGTGFADANSDGQLELVVHNVETWQSWSWNGAMYVARPCIRDAGPLYRGPYSDCGI